MMVNGANKIRIREERERESHIFVSASVDVTAQQSLHLHLHVHEPLRRVRSFRTVNCANGHCQSTALLNPLSLQRAPFKGHLFIVQTIHYSLCTRVRVYSSMNHPTLNDTQERRPGKKCLLSLCLTFTLSLSLSPSLSLMLWSLVLMMPYHLTSHLLSHFVCVYHMPGGLL